MQKQIKHWMIIGSSRGLGAAFVEEFLNRTSGDILGVARTSPDQIKNHEKWTATGRYRYLQLDIALSQSRQVLQLILQEIAPEPVGVIFNAAHIEKDLNTDQSLNYDAYEQVNRVGITGLGNLLFAFEPHLLTYGGILVGISSLWGSVPPLFLPWMAYPASKAYLNMAFHCLRVAWRKRVDVVLVNIGNIGGGEKSSLPAWIVPTYAMAAQKIGRALLRTHVPKAINYPVWHAVIYNYVLRFVPEFCYSWIFRLYFTLDAFQKRHRLRKS